MVGSPPYSNYSIYHLFLTTFLLSHTHTHTLLVDGLAGKVDTLQSNINLLLEQAEMDEAALQAAQGEEQSTAME